MARPEEDRGSAFVGDYGAIEADIAAMEDFAAGLQAEVADGYEPHLQVVITSMTTKLPPAAPNFPELGAFLTQHHKVQSTTFNNTFNFRDGTTGYALAAKEISDKYRDTDAFSHSKVKDVDRAFDNIGRTESP